MKSHCEAVAIRSFVNSPVIRKVTKYTSNLSLCTNCYWVVFVRSRIVKRKMAAISRMQAKNMDQITTSCPIGIEGSILV